MTRWLACIGLLTIPLGLTAHEIRPAYLEVTEIAAGSFDVLWKIPLAGDRYLPLAPIFPAHCTRSNERTAVNPDAIVERWRLDCADEGLDQATVTIAELPRTLTDVFVRILWLDRAEINALLKPDSPSLVVERKGAQTLISYLFLGIEHLLSGIDHILFVVGLLLLITNIWTLVKTITSFTLAHSITLGLSALDAVRLPQSPVEVAIALSILFLAVELTKGQTTSLMRERPWMIAFVFGLLHGFGFAGALREIGLPEDAALWALALFNVGVEIGQLLIVLPVAAAGYAMRRLEVSLPWLVARVPVWTMGVLAAYWVIDRSVQLV